MGQRHALTLPVEMQSLTPAIRYADAVLMTGSCFTEHIGAKLERYKYNVHCNPFGILYNPVSMTVALERITQLKYYEKNELVQQDGLYHSMDHHGSYSNKNADHALEKINKAIQNAHTQLKNAGAVVISPGTAKVFRYLPTMQVAGNCHKIPQSQFEHYRLSADECSAAFDAIYKSIRSINLHCSIIITISPVRHFRDGLVENQRSKATLFTGLNALQQTHSDVYYFPAYEIMMDELRDYRFYARDLVHPSTLAIDIIWEKFVAACLDMQDTTWHAQIESLRLAMEHRILHHDPETIRAFAAAQLKKVDQLAVSMPNLNWQAERQHFFQYLEQD